jgi:GNAT superfamily N-acetyltransferase
MPITVRDATPDDLDFIVAANASLAEDSESIGLDPGLLRPGVAAVLGDRSLGRYFVAERDGRPVGQLMLTYEWSDWRNGWFWWIQSVFVAADCRGQGVFSLLFRHVALLARESGDVCGLRLYVDRSNDRARAIYQHLGLHRSNYEVMEDVFRGPSSHSRT